MRGLCVAEIFEYGIIKIERQPPKQYVPIQSVAPLGALLHGAHIPISIILRTCFLDAPATRLVAGFIVKRKSTMLLASFGVVFLCLDYCVAKIYGCGIIKIERQPPTRWVADSMGQKIRLGEWQITEAVFLCA